MYTHQTVSELLSSKTHNITLQFPSCQKNHSKRDSSKNHLILQYIKHKLISIEKGEKEIEKYV